ncbi:hypothetical protein SXCC_00115 [Gluconacetobacter sp. SXCC-1]|nr:hypothetical protein SXCC_00115 [Gluconacetobacter sp. SXCC-1]
MAVATSFFGSFAPWRSIHTNSHSEGSDTAIREASVSTFRAARHWTASS